MDYGAGYDRSNYIMPTPDADVEEIVETAAQKARKIVKEDVFENAAIPDEKAITDSVAGRQSPPAQAAITTSSASMFDSLIGSKEAVLSEGADRHIDSRTRILPFSMYSCNERDVASSPFDPEY